VALLLIIPLILLVVAVVYGEYLMNLALGEPGEREERTTRFLAQRREQRRAERMDQRSAQFQSQRRVSSAARNEQKLDPRPD
jgi:hypothetical protein